MQDQGTPPSGAKREFCNVEDAAATLGISPMSIYRAIHDGRFPALRVGRRRYVVPVQALQEMLAATLRGGLIDAAAWTQQTAPAETAG